MSAGLFQMLESALGLGPWALPSAFKTSDGRQVFLTMCHSDMDPPAFFYLLEPLSFHWAHADNPA